MGRIGWVWCILVSCFVIISQMLTADLSSPRSDFFIIRMLENVEPSGLAVFLALLVLFLGIFLSAAVLCSAWNRIAPHILQGSGQMRFAEAYAIMLVFALIS